MLKRTKKDTQQRPLSDVEIHAYKTNLYSYSKPKWGRLQWLIGIHGSTMSANNKWIARG